MNAKKWQHKTNSKRAGKQLGEKRMNGLEIPISAYIKKALYAEDFVFTCVSAYNML